MDHLDLSYDAFEKLAHPIYGVMMMEYRPVDCDTQRPLPYNAAPYPSIYWGGIKAGWGWRPSKAIYAHLEDEGDVWVLNNFLWLHNSIALRSFLPAGPNNM